MSKDKTEETNEIDSADVSIDNESAFLDMCSDLEQKLTENFRQQREQIRALKRLYIKDMKRYYKCKPPTVKSKGFTKDKYVPECLTKYLGISKNTQMSRNSVCKLFREKLVKNNLVYAEDGRVYRADEEIQKLFGLDKSVNDSTSSKDKNGFNMYNLQTYIAACYAKM